MFFILNGCSNQKESEYNVTLTLKNQSGEISNVFNQGELIEVELSIENKSQNDKSLQFSTTKQFNIDVKDSSNNLIKSYPGKLAPADFLVTYINLEPNEKHTEHWEWNQLNSNNETLNLGNYSIEGAFGEYNGEDDGFVNVDDTESAVLNFEIN